MHFCHFQLFDPAKLKTPNFKSLNTFDRQSSKISTANEIKLDNVLNYRVYTNRWTLSDCYKMVGIVQ